MTTKRDPLMDPVRENAAAYDVTKRIAASQHGHACIECGGFYLCVDPDCDGNDTGMTVCCDCGGMYG